VFLSLVAIASLVVAVIAVEAEDGNRLSLAINATFNVVSVITTTGFASGEYDTWGPLSVAIFFVITFLGGCAGSTSGGFKTYRLMVLYQSIRVTMRQMVRPDVVMPIRYGDRTLPQRVVQSVTVFMSAFFAVLFIITVLIAATGVDLVTAFTGTLTALTNTGPGLGDIIGPSGSFQSLPEAAKWLLSFAMLLGRLEVMAVLILISPAFWRNF
jgi:trk system potassium uptake protein